MTTESETAKAARLAYLRREIETLERGGAVPVEAERGAGVALGAGALEACLPVGGLPCAALHEVSPAAAEWDDGPATGFVLALLGRFLAAGTGPAFWFARAADLHAPALAGFGVAHDRLVLGRAGDDRDVLWAMEEALGHPGVAAVIGEATALPRRPGRRLQLAAETSGVPALVLHRPRLAPSGRVPPSSAATRWRVGAAPMSGGSDGFPGGFPAGARWRVELLRCRGGKLGDFMVEWSDGTDDDPAGHFSLVAPFPGGAVAQGPDRQPSGGGGPDSSLVRRAG